MHELLPLNCFKINKWVITKQLFNAILWNLKQLCIVVTQLCTLSFVTKASEMHDLLPLFYQFKIYKLAMTKVVVIKTSSTELN